MLFNIIMVIMAVYVMFLPFLMFYFMTLIKSGEGNVTVETPRKKHKRSREQELELARQERRKAQIDANIEAFDGTSNGQVPIED